MLTNIHDSSNKSIIFENDKIKHCKGCLLYGPGTGKTLLTRAILKLFKNPAKQSSMDQK